MSRTLFPLRVSAAIASLMSMAHASHAMFLNPNGLGEALVFPYYTVNGGNSTLLSLTNTTSSAKALKLRFLEGHNSRDVLDFNLYLSPFDVWVGQVIPEGNGAGLFTPDNSCTVPKLPRSSATALAFSTAAFDGDTAQGLDGGAIDAGRTREGHIEVIEMGTLTNTTNKSLLASTHTSGGPNNCAQLVDAWDASKQGYWTTDPTIDLAAPSNGLTGSATILNVNRGTVFAYVAEAIAQFYATDTTPNGLHTSPASLTPNLSSATSLTTTTYQNDVLTTSSFARGIDAVSALFMADSLTNDYITSASIGASTEWIITYPTKRFYTDPFYTTTAASPFDRVFGADATHPGTSCSQVAYKPYDREETSVAVVFGGTLPPLPASAICSSVQVTTFNQTTTPTTILHSTLGDEFPVYGGLPFDRGWARMDFTRAIGNYPTRLHVLMTTDGKFHQGQPVAGFSVTQYINGSLTDSSGLSVQSNYTALYRHRFHTACVTDNVSEPCS